MRARPGTVDAMYPPRLQLEVHARWVARTSASSARGSAAVEYVGLTAVIAAMASTVLVAVDGGGLGDRLLAALGERLAESFDLAGQ